MIKHYITIILTFLAILALSANTGKSQTVTPLDSNLHIVSPLGAREPEFYKTPAPAPLLPIAVSDIRLLSKTVWGEAQGGSPDEQRLVIWTVFQRVDAGGWYGSNIAEVITKKGQFVGYCQSNPLEPEIYDLCVEEARKWVNGDPPPILAPYASKAPYFFFNGNGLHNWFREEY